jgi:Tfp pilus assembly protein PilX
MSSPPPPWQAPPPRPRADANHEPAPGPSANQSANSERHSGHDDSHEHTRLALIIALTIAVVSVLGAVVGWRAEVHAARASRYEQDAVAASITAAQLRSEAEAAAGKAYSQFAHYQRLGNEANEITPGACAITDRTNIIDIDAGVVCSTQIQFSGYNGTGYVDDQGHFDLEKYAKDVQAGNATQNDIEPDSYQEQAEQERNREDNMLYLSLFLVIALALLTLARLGKSTGSRLILAVPGWLCLAGGTLVLVIAEV